MKKAKREGAGLGAWGSGQSETREWGSVRGARARARAKPVLFLPEPQAPSPAPFPTGA